MNIEVKKKGETRNYVRYDAKIAEQIIITIYLTPDRLRTPHPDVLMVTITDPGLTIHATG